MEIDSFLRLTPRRLVALFVVAALGAAAGMAFALQAPAEYTTSATIRVGDIFAPAGNNYEINPYALAMVEILREGPIQDEVADAAGTDRAAMDTFEASQPEEGGPVLVAVTSADVKDNEAIIEAAATTALTEYTDRLVDRATKRRETTQDGLAEATANLDEWQLINGYGYGLPEQLNLIQLRELPEARADVQNPELTTAFAEARVAELEQAVDEARLLLPELAPLSQEYDRAVARDSEASGDQLVAQDAQNLIAAGVGDYVVEGESDSVARMPDLMRGAIGGAVALAGLLFAVFVFRAVRRERRTARSRRPVRSAKATQQPARPRPRPRPKSTSKLKPSRSQKPKSRTPAGSGATSSGASSTPEPVTASSGADKDDDAAPGKRSAASRRTAGPSRKVGATGSSRSDSSPSADTPKDSDSATPATSGGSGDSEGGDDAAEGDSKEKVPANAGASGSKAPARRPSKSATSRRTGRGAAGSPRR